MNFYPFITLHSSGEPFAVRSKSIIRFENREITTVDTGGKYVSEIVDETFEEIESKIQAVGNFTLVDAIAEIGGEQE